MNEAEAIGEYTREIPKEKDLRQDIRKAIIGLEVRITLDKLMNLREAKLMGLEGDMHDISVKTVERYHQCNYLIRQYTENYGTCPEFEAAKKRWWYLSD